MNSYAYIVWIPLLPLAGFVLLGVFGRWLSPRLSAIAGTSLLLGATVLSFLAAYQYLFRNGLQDGVYPKLTVFSATWLSFSESMQIDMKLLIDPLTLMMLVVVSFVSLMVHLFSAGYMKGEKRFTTYYAYLSLFSFSMLGLVLAGNLFQVYIFWELVGVSSFLLIGFYYEKPAAIAAARKAFIITRFADLGFLIGILVLSFYGRTFDIQSLVSVFSAPQSDAVHGAMSDGFIGLSALTWGLLLLFAGGAGKSAMFPLHVWLPDAMEGPTPVSALIHAATMVVAGVYLVARLFPVFSLDGLVMDCVTWVGLLSSVFAALVACTQTDIKRVLAYSTMSQIGYMMFALGISVVPGGEGSGYTASLFHLFTHAFFKSLLFLCAGVIIHLVHTNDIQAMGGLRKMMPLTHACFLVACLAISGLPPFAGFFSKEAILSAAFHSGGLVYGIALLTSMLTAFYMFRLYFSVFWHRDAQSAEVHARGEWPMQLPLVLLLCCTVLAGFLPFNSWISADGRPYPAHIDLVFSIAPVVLSLAAIALAMRWYKTPATAPAGIAARWPRAYRTVVSKFYIDELWLWFTRSIVFRLFGKPAAWIDRNIVDGAMNGLAGITLVFSKRIRGWQSGKLPSYALCFFAGIAVLTILFVYLWK